MARRSFDSLAGSDSAMTDDHAMTDDAKEPPTPKKRPLWRKLIVVVGLMMFAFVAMW